MEIKFDFELLNKQRRTKLTRDIAALNEYKNNSGFINYFLLRGFVSPRVKQENYTVLGNLVNESLLTRLIYDIDQNFVNEPKSYKTNYLYRGIYMNTPTILHSLPTKKNELPIIDWYINNIGNCILSRSFTSTSFDPHRIIGFSDGLILKFIIPPNFPILCVDSILGLESDFDTENEILLPRNTFFYIKSIKHNVKFAGKYYIVITLDPRLCKQMEYKKATIGPYSDVTPLKTSDLVLDEELYK